MKKVQTAGKNRTISRTVAAFAVSSLAVMAVFAASPRESAAYFTAYDTAEWEQKLGLGSETEIIESYENGVKTVVIENTGETECQVRVKIFAGSQVGLTIAGDGWSENMADGYWYYTPFLKPKTAPETEKTTAPLKITVDLSKAPTGGEGEDAFVYDQNVVVIQECAQVFYRDKEDGTQEAYAAWDLSMETQGEGAGT